MKKKKECECGKYSKWKNILPWQCIDVAMFTGGHHSARIAKIETTEVVFISFSSLFLGTYIAIF